MKEILLGLLVVGAIVLAYIFSSTFGALWAALALAFAFLSWQDQEIYKMLNARIARLELIEHSRRFPPDDDD